MLARLGGVLALVLAVGSGMTAVQGEGRHEGRQVVANNGGPAAPGVRIP
ncbi:hypothetical protein ACWDBF_26305 [Streptomyces angustmyceticus]|nr:hypothetical protein [Streptomyces angustmyceticus]